LNPDVFLLLLILGAAAVVPWLYGHNHRPIAWLFGATAFLLVAGIPAWRDALVSVIATKNGLAILAGVDIAFGIAFWVEATHPGKRAARVKGQRRPKAQNKHRHRIRTPVVSVVFGTAVALTLGAGAEMLAELRKSPAAANAAISASRVQIAQISAGHAAPMPQHRATMILLIGAGILLLLIIAGYKAEQRRHEGAPAASGFTTPELPASGGFSRGAAPSAPRRGVLPGRKK